MTPLPKKTWMTPQLVPLRDGHISSGGVVGSAEKRIYLEGGSCNTISKTENGGPTCGSTSQAIEAGCNICS